jgi:hypothetical protein
MNRQPILAATVLSLSLIHPLIRPGVCGEPLKPTAQWKGRVADRDLEKEKPEKGLITTQEAFTKLWKAWRGEEKPPAVDFDKEVVIVVTSKTGELRSLLLQQDDKGNVALAVGISREELKGGFSYVMGSLKREGVKTIDGKEIPKK